MWCKHTCPRNTKTVQRNLSPMPLLLGELVDDAFDFGELGGFEVFVARFDCRSHAALDMRLEHVGVNAREALAAAAPPPKLATNLPKPGTFAVAATKVSFSL